MPAVVIDASALVELLLTTPRAAAVSQAVRGGEVLAPDLVNLEVSSVLRRMWQLGEIDEEQSGRAIGDLQAAPIRRIITTLLLPTIWSLRHNVSSYDASYVALALALACPLVTGDQRLSRASGLGIALVLV